MSVTSRSSIETSQRIELPSTYPTVVYKEILVPPKTRALPPGTLFQTLDFLEFRWFSKQNSSTVELVDHTYDGRRVMVYYTSVDCKLLAPFLALLWICCTTCSYGCAAVDKISTDTARRAVRLRYCSYYRQARRTSQVLST